MRPADFLRLSISVGLSICALGLSPAKAQFEPPTVQNGPKLPAVVTFPTPGAYTNTTGVALRDADPGAEIRYTLDGGKPTSASPKVERGQVLFLAGVYDDDKGLKTAYTVRAVATKAGMTDSDPATFVYTIDRRDRTAYVSEEVAPGVRMVRDSDNDKMFLVKGAKAYALIDSGLGRGALKLYLSQFTGGLPIVPIFTHNHGDHIGQANQFIEAGPEYIGGPDRPGAVQLLQRQGVPQRAIDANLKAVADGDRIDLGDRALEIYSVAGHTPGSIVVFDPATGNLFTGDSFGNNSPLPPDVMWMQGDPRPLDAYLANVRTVRARLGDRVKRIMTGHNDRPLIGTAYLDNLQRAMQRLLDEGEGALIPSWRPPGLFQVVEGDRFTDPNWFGANINRQTYLPAKPDQIAGLTGLALTGAELSQPFDPAIHDYKATAVGRAALTLAAYPTSTRSRALAIAGKPVAPGRPVVVKAGRTIAIEVTAPDGATTATYHLTISSRP